MSSPTQTQVRGPFEDAPRGTQDTPEAAAARRPTASSDAAEPRRPSAEGEAEGPPAHIGRYEIRGELGRGGVGVVYEAWDPQLQRPVALKTLIAGRDASASQIERFLREVRASARLRHPHIVAVYDAGTDGGRFYLAMDRIDGQALDRVLDREGLLGPRRAVKLLLPIAEALGFAHAQGFVHRDVKPENVLIDGAGRAFLTDFGLAIDLTDPRRLTRTDQSVGTPAFMAPEQLSGRAADPRVDVYSLGATLYECLTGRVPFEADSFPELARRVLEQEPRPPRALEPRIAPDLEAVVLRCLEKRPSDRYRDGAELARDLERFLAGEAVEARAPSALRRLGRLVRRHRPVAAGTVVALLGLVGGAGYALVVEAQAAAGRRQQANLEQERARLLAAHEAAVRRSEHEEARRAAFAEAALATDVEGQVAAYDALLEQYPDSWEARLLRARLLRALCQEYRVGGRDLDGAAAAARRAIEDIQHALQAARDPAPLLLLQAEILRADLDDAEAAGRAYEQLAGGSTALAAYARARLALAAGALAEALAAVDAALAERPELAPARLLRAEALLRSGEPAAALAEVERVAGHPATEAETMCLRGQALRALGGAEEAEREALRAVELDPTDAAATLLLARLRLDAGRPAHALAALRGAQRGTVREPAVWLLEALALLRGWADLPEALAAVERARALDREGRAPAPDELALLAEVRAEAEAVAADRGEPLDDRARALLLGVGR